MNLAIEYLVRNDLIKEMLAVPCSLFLTKIEGYEYRVLTLHENDYFPDSYVVKHWHVSKCTPDSVLPSLSEYVVKKEDIFTDSNVILSEFFPLLYHSDSVPSNLNSYAHPMQENTYNYYLDNQLNSASHQLSREEWLWDKFIEVYFHQDLLPRKYIVGGLEFEGHQRFIRKHFQKHWHFWLRWRKYMLDFPGTPGELVFMKEYEEEPIQGGNSCYGFFI